MRIASLVPSATEMLFAIGLGDSVVAVTHECDYPERARSLPQLTRTVVPPGLDSGEIDREVRRIVSEGRPLYELDTTRLAEAAPDLIVAQQVCEVCAVSYEDVLDVAARLPGQPPVLSQDPSTLDDVLTEITRLAEVAGRGADGEALRNLLSRRLDSVAAAVSGRPRPRTLALEWLDPPFVGGHWVPEMIAAAGGEDPIARPGAPSFEVSWSRLVDARPEVAVVMPCGYHLEQSLQEARMHSEPLGDLGSAQTFAVDAASSFSRPGPRLIDGVELLAHLLHPGAVPPPAGIGFAAL